MLSRKKHTHPWSIVFWRRDEQTLLMDSISCLLNSSLMLISNERCHDVILSCHAESIPALTTLILTNNRIKNLQASWSKSWGQYRDFICSTKLLVFAYCSLLSFSLLVKEIVSVGYQFPGNPPKSHVLKPTRQWDCNEAQVQVSLHILSFLLAAAASCS